MLRSYLILVSPLHARMRKGLVKRVPCPQGILQPNQVAKLWSYDNLVECNYVRSVLMRVRLAYAHGTEEVAVSVYFTHTRILFQPNALVRPF